MVGYYNKAAPEPPVIVRLVDRVSSHRSQAAVAGALVLGLLIGVSVFVPAVGLTLILLALLAVLGLWLFARAQSTTHPHAHWSRHAERR